MKNLFKYIWNRDRSEMESLSAERYRAELLELDEEQAECALEKAWEIRNFEIEMYWKRASYFWAFIASTFVGYFALVNSESYAVYDKYQHVEVYFLICIGFVLSCAWLLTNVGSKQWQRNWEAHVDLLEDPFNGPLYKTVNMTESYSVSKINEIVSLMFVIVWMILGIKYLIDKNLIDLSFQLRQVNWFVVLSTLLSLLAVVAMWKGHGRGRFGGRDVLMYRRRVQYSDNEPSTAMESDA